MFCVDGPGDISEGRPPKDSVDSMFCVDGPGDILEAQTWLRDSMFCVDRPGDILRARPPQRLGPLADRNPSSFRTVCCSWLMDTYHGKPGRAKYRVDRSRFQLGRRRALGPCYSVDVRRHSPRVRPDMWPGVTHILCKYERDQQSSQVSGQMQVPCVGNLPRSTVGGVSGLGDRLPGSAQETGDSLALLIRLGVCAPRVSSS